MLNQSKTISIIGGGFAGVEAAYFLAKKGFKVELYEMRGKKTTEVHKTNFLAELVCSNSFKSMSIENAHGLLKEELSILGSLIVEIAKKTSVPAGQALAVDREKFSQMITQLIQNMPNITIINEEVTTLDKWINSNETVIIATGPLTSENLQKSIIKLIGENSLFFFDAAAPIIEASTIDYDKAFFQSRYDKGTADYLNCPMTKDEYMDFVRELNNADVVTPHDFETKKLFSGCSPVEDIAKSGDNSLAFGPMKPVGIIDPKTNKQPYAVVQLRKENISSSMYNIVGFQTRMKWGEQKRIIRMVPGLENAEILRYGVIHKNFYLDFPKIVDSDYYSIKNHNNIFFAGQITGVEGYIESTASGLYTAYSVIANINKKPIYLPNDTMIGSLQQYTITPHKRFQPMASNFGLIDSKNILANKRVNKKEKKKIIAEHSIKKIKKFYEKNI